MKASKVFTLIFAGVVTSERLWVYPSDTKNNMAVANLNVVSNGKEAYLGDYTKLGDSQFVPVTFNSIDDLPTKLVLNPDTVADASPTWSNRILGIPKSGNKIVLLDPDTNNTDYITDFWTYQSNIFPWDGNTFVSWEYAVSTDKTGLYTLEYWPSWTAPSSYARITLRSHKL